MPVTRSAFVALVCSALFAASCASPPPRPWLHYAPAGESTWQGGADGLLSATFLGASAVLSLRPDQTCIELTVRNTTETALEFRVGPDGALPRQAIGELLLRQFAPPSVGGPEVVPYLTQQPVVVQPGWRAVFYLDAPLGREPGIGQYLVLQVEARNPAGLRERRNLPLVATNVLAATAPRR